MLLLVPPADGLGMSTVAEAAADGFIVVGLVAERDEVVSLRARQAPIVLVDADAVPDIPLVAVDERAAMADLTRRLLALGHRRLGVAGIETGEAAGPSAWTGPMRHRWDGVMDAVADSGIPEGAVTVDVVEVSSSEAGGLLAFEGLWNRGASPSVIVAFSDEIALGVLTAAKAAGVVVPTQLSVTGFDDVDAARRSEPPLTTVRQPIVEKGNLAARRLVALMAGEAVDDLTVLHATVIERESVGVPAQI
jgi:DNA-binding LacI/PurR family transcriptional regulator